MKKLSVLSLFFVPFVAFAAMPASVNDIYRLMTIWLGYFIGAFWVFATGAIIYSALLFVNSKGEPERVKKAKGMLIYTVVAIAVALLSTGMRVLITSVLSGK